MGVTKVNAIASCKCPQCRTGKVFKYKPSWKLAKMTETYEKCSVCDFRYEIEPGFFWAAMYISYAINVAIIITFFLAINIFIGTKNPLHYLIPIILAVLLPFPFTLRYSRMLLLHFFSGAKYNSNLATEKHNAEQES